MLANGLQFLIDLVPNMITYIIGLLPLSPFQGIELSHDNNQLLQWLAWLVPFPFIISVLSLWLTAIFNFYFFKVGLRKFNVIS